MSFQTQSTRRYPPKPADVYLFATCLVDQFAPEAGLDTVRLLKREGIRVHFLEQQTCCGQPAHSSGYPDEARTVALQQLKLFTQPWPVVVPSGSCGGMIRHHCPALFANDPVLHAQALELSERVYELSEFLVQVVNFNQPDLGEACTVALHTSCHARRQMGSHDTSSALLDSLAQVTVVEQARIEECCGFGGDRGFVVPELNAHALRKVHEALPSNCCEGVSTNRTCEIGLTSETGRSYRSIAYLLEECTQEEASMDC